MFPVKWVEKSVESPCIIPGICKSLMDFKDTKELG